MPVAEPKRLDARPDLAPGEFWVADPDDDDGPGWHHLNAFDAGDAASDIAEEVYHDNDHPELQTFIVEDADGRRWKVDVRTELSPRSRPSDARRCLVPEPRRYRLYTYYQDGRHHSADEKPFWDAGHARYPEPEDLPGGVVARDAYHRGWRCAEHEHRARIVEAERPARIARMQAALKEFHAKGAQEDEPLRRVAREKGAKAWREGVTLVGLKAVFSGDPRYSEIKRGWAEARKSYYTSLLPGAGEREGA